MAISDDTKKAKQPDASRMAGLLVVAHGERGGAAENRLVHELVARLREANVFSRVEAGFIRSEPSIEDAAARLGGGALTVYPLFMSDGYYVRQAIPQRLGTQGAEILTPLGLDAALPPLVAEIGMEAAHDAGLDPAMAHLLMVAHGSSKSGESAAAARAVAARIAAAGDFASLTVAFLEEEPFLDAALKKVPGPAILLGLFAGDGMHAAEDLPEALKQSGRRDVVLAGSLGTDPRLADLVVSAITVHAKNHSR
jgi:sirohydrochlorin ferrochelatase